MFLTLRALTASSPDVGSSRKSNSGVGVVGQADGVEQLHRIQGVDVVQRREEPQVLQTGELLVMVRQLEGDPDALVVVGPPGQRVLTPHRRLAAVAAEQADQKLLGGGLPGAAGSEESKNLPPRDAEVHA